MVDHSMTILFSRNETMPIEDKREGKYRFSDWYPFIAKTYYTICLIYNKKVPSHYLLMLLVEFDK